MNQQPNVAESGGNVFVDMGLPWVREKTDAARLRVMVAQYREVIRHYNPDDSVLDGEKGRGMPSPDILLGGTEPTVSDIHATMLRMVDARINTVHPERGRELIALADACAAIEGVIQSLGGPAADAQALCEAAMRVAKWANRRALTSAIVDNLRRPE